LRQQARPPATLFRRIRRRFHREPRQPAQQAGRTDARHARTGLRAPERPHQSIDIGHPVDQPRLLPRQPPGAASAHPILEARVQPVEQRLDECHVLRLLRQERIEPRLVRAGGVEASKWAPHRAFW